MNSTTDDQELEALARKGRWLAISGTVRLTTAQALVRYLSGLRTRVESPQGDQIVPLFGGVLTGSKIRSAN